MALEPRLPPPPGGIQFTGAAQITGVVAGGDVTNSGVLNIYALQVTAAQARELQQAPPDRAAIPLCPYPGMLPFRPEDARFFHGRAPEIRDLLFRLRDGRQLLVVGPSGSGKSSLVLAGLLPQLAASSYWPPGYWLPIALRPGAQPLDRLVASLGGDLTAPSDRLTTLLAAHPPAGRVLLVVDQLEEIFTQADRGQQSAFISALQALRRCDTIALILTMRADFYPDLMLSDLWEAVRETQYGIPPLRGDGLRDAIRLPAAQVGVVIDPSLVERLLADAAEEPGSLPLLQECLALLWGQMQNRVLSREDYAALGHAGRSGLAVALAHKADATYAALPGEHQGVARRLFLRLVQFGEGRADTRRQQPVSALRSVAEDTAVFAATLTALTDARLLIVGGNPADADRTVDLAHEALIAGWPTFQAWLAARREAEQTRRRLEAKAQEWVRLGRGRGGLLDEAELPEAERWLAGPDAAELGAAGVLPALVRASRSALDQASAAQQAQHQQALERERALAAAQRQRAEEQTRATRRFRALAAGLALMLGVAVLAALWAQTESSRAQTESDRAGQQAATAQAERGNALLQRATADAERNTAVQQQATAEAQRQRADSQARVAVARQLAAQALPHLTDQLDLALLLSVEANGSAHTVEARSALLTGLVAHPYLRTLLHGLSGFVTQLAFSPDNRWLAAAGQDRRIVIWDVATHRPLHPPLAGHTGAITALAFSPDSQTLASGSEDKTIILWDVASGRARTAPLVGPGYTITSIAFSPDGSLLASGSCASEPADGCPGSQIWLWDAAHYRPLGAALADPQIRTPEDTVRRLAFSPDSRILIAGHDDGTVLWDVPSRQRIGQPFTSTHLLFSADSQTWAVTGPAGTVGLWAAATRQLRTTLRTGAGAELEALALSPDGQWLAATQCQAYNPTEDCAQGRLYVWNLGTGRLLHDYGDPLRKATHGLTFSPDSATVIWWSQDGVVTFWDVGTGRVRAALAGYALPDGQPLFSPDHRLLTSGSYAGTVLLWDVPLAQPGTQLLQDADASFSTALDPGGRWVAVGGCSNGAGGGCGNGVIRLWDTGTHQPLAPPAVLSTFTVDRLLVSPDGQTLAAGTTANNAVILWNVGTRRQLGAPLAGGTLLPGSMAFSPDSRVLAVGQSDNKIGFWDVATQQPMGAFLASAQAPVTALAFSRDGQMLAAAICGVPDADNQCPTPALQLWDVASRQLRGTFPTGAMRPIGVLAFSPDGSLLISGGVANPASDSNLSALATGADISLWDVARRQLLGRLPDSLDTTAVAVSPDGQTLVSSNNVGTVSLWDLFTRQRVAVLHPGTEDAGVGIAQVAFQSDGRTVRWAAPRSEFAELLEWNVDLAHALTAACGVANRNLTPTEWTQYMPAGLAYRPTCPDLPAER